MKKKPNSMKGRLINAGVEQQLPLEATTKADAAEAEDMRSSSSIEQHQLVKPIAKVESADAIKDGVAAQASF